MEYPAVTQEEEEAWFSLNPEELDNLWKKWIADLGPPEEPAFRFLDLPPELRNRVYHFALGNNGNPVLITKNLRPPGLLSTCTQIRDEALYIWYTRNEFRIKIVNCNPLYRLAFEKHIETLGNGMEARIKIEMRLQGANWRNLVKWCYLVWLRALTPVLPDPSHKGLWKVISAATMIAYHARPRTEWKDCKAQTEAIRTLAEKMDRRLTD